MRIFADSLPMSRLRLVSFSLAPLVFAALMVVWGPLVVRVSWPVVRAIVRAPHAILTPRCARVCGPGGPHHVSDTTTLQLQFSHPYPLCVFTSLREPSLYSSSGNRKEVCWCSGRQALLQSSFAPTRLRCSPWLYPSCSATDKAALRAIEAPAGMS